MDDFLIFIVFLFAITLFIVGAMKRNVLFLGFSGVALLFIGLFIFFGIQLPSGAIITTVGNTSTIVDTSIAWGGSFKNPFAWLFTLIGLGIILFSAIKFLEKPSSIDLGDD